MVHDWMLRRNSSFEDDIAELLCCEAADELLAAMIELDVGVAVAQVLLRRRRLTENQVEVVLNQSSRVQQSLRFRRVGNLFDEFFRVANRV